MVNIRRYNPVLKERLMQMVKVGDAVGMKAVLNSLSVAESRTAGIILSEQILPSMSSSQYWNFFIHIVPSNSKAYLGTFLKAAQSLLKFNKLEVNQIVVEEFSQTATPIDIKKFVEIFFSELRNPEQIQLLVSVLFKQNRALALSYLINAGTAPSYYVLFKLLKVLDCDAVTLRMHVISLMKSDKKLAFNMASILKQYFDLQQIPGHFSLQMQPYELSRLDESYESFVKVLKR